MAFCPNCGSSVEGRFCAKCGTAVGAGAAAGSTAGSTAGAAAGAAPGYQAPPPPPGAQPYAAAPATAGLAENAASALCYLLGLITGILFLVLAPYNQNRNIRFHAFQSIFLHVAFIVLAIVATIVSSILLAILPFGLYMLSTLISLVIWGGGFVLWVLLLIKTYNGSKIKLPVIGDLAEKQA